MKPKVYVTRPDYPSVGIDLLKEEGYDLTIWPNECIIPRDELLKNVTGRDAIFCSINDRIDKEVLDHAGPSLKVIGLLSVGHDHIDVEECIKRGIRVGFTPDIPTDSTAELTIALLLALARRLFEANREVYNGGWKSWSPMWMCGQSIKNSVVGIFGFGRIGQEIARRLVAFKPKNILFTNRSDKAVTGLDIGAIQVPFSNLLTMSDYLIITCSYNTDTINLFNESTFAKMKPSACLINTSRGGVVNQDDLYHALKTGKIRAAGLNVTTPEPLPLDSPILRLPNCVILPHIGSADVDTRTEMSRITACNISAGLKGLKMISELL